MEMQGLIWYGSSVICSRASPTLLVIRDSAQRALNRKQQEPKILAVVCQDENLIKSFKEGKDIYSFIASIAFNTTYEACLENLPTGEYDEDGNEIKVYQPDGKARRSEAKTVVLGRPIG